MSRLLVLSVVMVLALQAAALSSPRGIVSAKAEVTVYPEQTMCPLRETLFGTNVHSQDKLPIAKQATVDEFLDF